MAGAYTAACTSAGCRVLVAVTEAYNAHSKELDLAGNHTIELLDARLVDLDMAPLAVALEEDNPFQVIDVSYNTLGAGAAESLKKLVATDNTITALDLSNNDFTESASQALCTGLKQNKSIAELKLSGNKLGSHGGMALADLLQSNSTIERLYASNCELDTAALVALATVLRDNTSLRVLDVSRPLAKTLMEEPAAHFARMLKVNSTLIELDMSKAGVGDFGLQLIAEETYRAGASSRLQVLKLQCNKIGLVQDDCVQALMMLLQSEHCRLQVLMLGHNSLRDEGALKLAEIVSMAKYLQHLDVQSCSITSRGLCALARSVVNRAAEAEQEDNPALHMSVESMELWGNRFDSAACLAWIPALHYLKLDIAVQEVDGAYNCVRC